MLSAVRRTLDGIVSSQEEGDVPAGIRVHSPIRKKLETNGLALTRTWWKLVATAADGNRAELLLRSEESGDHRQPAAVRGIETDPRRGHNRPVTRRRPGVIKNGAKSARWSGTSAVTADSDKRSAARGQAGTLQRLTGRTWLGVGGAGGARHRRAAPESPNSRIRVSIRSAETEYLHA
jgi:hypothetical protein